MALQTMHCPFKALLRGCTKNTAQGGMSRDEYVQHKVKPSAVFISRHAPSAAVFVYMSSGGAFKWYTVFWVTIELYHMCVLSYYWADHIIL